MKRFHQPEDTLVLVRQSARLRAVCHDIALLARVTYAMGVSETPSAIEGLLDDSDALLSFTMATVANQGVGQSKVLEAARAPSTFKDVFQDCGLIVGSRVMRSGRCMSDSAHTRLFAVIEDASGALRSLAADLADLSLCARSALGVPRIMSSSTEADEDQQQIAMLEASTIAMASRSARELEVALVRVRSMFVSGAIDCGIDLGPAR